MTSYTETRTVEADGTVIVTRTAEPEPPHLNGNGRSVTVVDADPTGPGHDDDYVFTTNSGKTIRIRSMAKDYSQMTLLVLKAKSGKDWPEIEAILEEMEEDEFKAFSEGYSEHSGVNTGESPASRA